MELIILIFQHSRTGCNYKASQRWFDCADTLQPADFSAKFSTCWRTEILPGWYWSHLVMPFSVQ